MFFRGKDIVCIGDITTDAFIRLKDAHIHCKLKNHECELCFGFGDKVPFEYVKIIKGVGNSANASVCASRLGLKTLLISNIGDDQNGKDCKMVLKENGVDTSLLKEHKNKVTNYHFVLWYSNDRTILVNHVDYEYRLPRFSPPKWIYLTSLGSSCGKSYYGEIANYIKANPEVKLAFQPGTYQIQMGAGELQNIYKLTDTIVINLEEAVDIVKNTKMGGPSFKEDPKSLLRYISELGPKLVVITDGPRGSFMYDGEHYYHMPMYPDPRPPVERTGCGDAWASTFVSMLAYGKPPLEAIMYAPINPMSVAQFIGSQQGLLKKDQLDWWLDRAPHEYRPKEI